MNTSIQTVSKSDINLLDLLLIKSDTCRNKTQVECVELDQKDNDVIDFDSAILLVGRFNNNKQIQYYFNHSHSSHNQYDDLSHTCDFKYQIHSNKQRQINVVDQMIAESYIPYSLLPKYFKSQQSYLVNNNDDSIQQHQWQTSFRDRYFIPNNFYYESYKNNCYNSHSYRGLEHCSYAINRRNNPYLHSNQQRGRYRYKRNGNSCVHDDHRVNTFMPDKYQ
ncbi:unnamed protein product [Adineta steineri]|uniref:Uncharacterized protein n=1 Tax=Adineta steineri TaxID=433720 RepID=A0A818Y1T2_9BILA|nr:unnamed protein product [Adineta steineri]